MLRFSKLTEGQVEQIIQKSPKPTTLTDDIKSQVLEKVNNIDIDLEDLASYDSHSNRVIIGEPPFGPDDDDDYDEDEYYAKQIEKFIEDMKIDGIVNFIDLPEEKWNDTSYLKRLETEIEVWLESIQPVGYWGY